jgi:peptidyl-prolyl cis-trans isomerase SurA
MGGDSVISNRRKGGCGLFVMAAACVAAICAAPPRAFAQHVVLKVNGEVITDYDIEQRSKFAMLATHKQAPRQQVIEQLIDEKLKIQVGRRYKIEMTDNDVDRSYAEMAHRINRNWTADQLTQALAQAGVDSATLKAQIMADLAWQTIIRGRFQSSLQLNEKSIIDEMQTHTKDDSTPVIGYDYTLHPILFVVARGESALAEARRRDAEALRARFTSCDAGLSLARSLAGVVVRDPITKNSSELGPALRDILDKTEIGHLTAAEVTPQGVELFALCAKKENKADTPEKAQAREKLFAEQFESKAKHYLQELRRQMMIERPK